MSAQHTPGPWTVDKMPACDVPFRDVNILRADGHAAAVAIDADINEDELVANARLIAAAPDMLAALEALFVATGGLAGPAANAARLAGAAIAKARGYP
jgi:prepilin-type processing-associated H-X9-DG protein